jgi:sulfate adenylyltransferase
MNGSAVSAMPASGSGAVSIGGLVPPHGGALRPLILEGRELMEERRRAASLQAVGMNSKETSDLVMLAMGAFSPLEGFMTRSGYLGVVDRMLLEDGILWSIPVTLAASEELAGSIREGQDVALLDDATGETMGVMEVREKYSYDRGHEAREVYRTEQEAHPGVQRLFRQGSVYLGGPLKAFSEGGYPARFPEFARPAETRAIFGRMGWRTVAAFQTRNPLHRSHEYLLKIAIEVSDGILLHPIVGALKADDVPAEVRMRCYQALLDGYFPKDRVVLKVYPMEMRYGGPREAVLHAIIRQNFGCSHLIVGRDHAGVGNYYGPFDAQRIFDELPIGSLAIRPLKLDNTFWCHRCIGMASPKTCPHSEKDRLSISGTELRKMLSEGRQPPAEYSRPEVLDILIEYYRGQRGGG